MRVSDFDFSVPSSLIANYPYLHRSNCRLLSMDGDTGKISHGIFLDIIDQLRVGDLLVFNDTKVIYARFFGYTENGKKVEFLIERILSRFYCLAQIRSSKSIKIGTKVFCEKDKTIECHILSYENNFFKLFFKCNRSVLEILKEIGHIPIPPYIKRQDCDYDRDLYQTVYSKKYGSIAAPTAGLHFDRLLLDILRKKGVHMVFLTLHIGSGTFQPVRVNLVEDHIMHSEYVEVSQDVVNMIKECKKRGKRVIAVGTSTLRALESACNSNILGDIVPFFSETNIFIYPGYRYHIVDALITNFHFPKSTLIMLVCSFLGYQYTMFSYKIAIKKKYYFFSYGDAMFITRNNNAPDEKW